MFLAGIFQRVIFSSSVLTFSKWSSKFSSWCIFLSYFPFCCLWIVSSSILSKTILKFQNFSWSSVEQDLCSGLFCYKIKNVQVMKVL